MPAQLGQGGLGFGQAPQQQPAPGHDQPGLQRIGPVGACFEHRHGGLQRVRRPTQIPHGQSHFGLGHHAPGMRVGLVSPEAARRTTQQFPGSRVLAQLSHGDAAQGERGRVVAQRYPLEGSQGITQGQGPRSGGDEGIHAGGLSEGGLVICCAQPRSLKGTAMNDTDVVQDISALVEEEQRLRNDTEGAGGHAERIRKLEEQLDQCWDLLRQRRAKAEFGDNPDEAKPRDIGTVESYLN